MRNARPSNTRNRPHKHDSYCVLHSRQSGYMIAEAATEQEAWEKWNSGDVIEKSFDRSEL